MTQDAAAEARAAASFGVSLRVQGASAAAAATPEWAAPAGVRELATTRAARFRLFGGATTDAAARYRAALTAQGYSLIEERDDGVAWTAQWRRGPNQCFEVVAQRVLGADAVRIVERGRGCGG